MAGVLRLCFAVALLVVACADDGSEPKKTPLGQDINSVAARIEKMCLKKVGMTPEEVKILEDIMQRLEKAKKDKKKHTLDLLDYVDMYAPRKEISKDIRAKWDAFANCVAEAAAGEM
uniref:Uncharacterized protein n=1 Tax=Rhipicephalus appendiculatus TaxID=34631 RepID=A0A131Z3J2_RHIAP